MNKEITPLKDRILRGAVACKEAADDICLGGSLRVYELLSSPINHLDAFVRNKVSRPIRKQILSIIDVPQKYIDDESRSLRDLVTTRVRGLDMLRWNNIKWYGGLTVTGAAAGETMHDIADMLNIKPNLSLLQLLGLAFVLSKVGQRFGARVIDRTDEFHQLNRELRQWVSSMMQVIDGGLVKESVLEDEAPKFQLVNPQGNLIPLTCEPEKKVSETQETAAKISDFMLVLVTIAESFEHPGSPDFESFFTPGNNISITTQDPYRSYGEQKQILLCDEVSAFLSDLIGELQLDKDTISNSDRVEMLTRVKDKLVYYLHSFTRRNIIPDVQGDVYAEISDIGGLVGRYDTNSTEGMKAPEWVFFALAGMYATVSFYLPDDHKGNTIMGTALLGYFGAMMRDYYYGNSGPTAIDPRDGALNRAKLTIVRRDLSKEISSEQMPAIFPAPTVDLDAKKSNRSEIA